MDTDIRKDKAILDAALSYAARGWLVIPLHEVLDGGACSCGGEDGCKPGKHPRTPHGSKDGTCNATAIRRRRWWSTRWPTANVGICTGRESGLCVIGPDGQAGIDALAGLERRHGALPRTVTARTGSGGRHHFFRWPAEGNITNRRDHQGLPIDVRGEGGYVVAAPSRNAKGPYVWEIAPDAAEVAVAPQWVLDWCRTDARQEEAAGAAGSNGQPGPFHPRAAGDGASVVDRAIAYLATMPPAISGQGGHDQTMEAARVVCWGFDLGEEAGYRIMEEHYNPRCQPPWTEKELRHKCRDAVTKPFGKPRGWLLDEPTRNGPPGAHPKGTTPATPKPPPLPQLPYCHFPTASLPPIVREYVQGAADAIGCDVALVALPALAVVASAIGNSRAAMVKAGWHEPPVLWTATVAPSGELKSPGFDAAVKPLQEVQLDLADEAEEEHERHREEDRA